MIELIAGKDDSGRRLDRILRKALPDLSLSLIHRLLRQKKILVDNKPASPDHRIEQGMVIKVYVDATNISNRVNNPNVNHEKHTVNKSKLTQRISCAPVPSPQSPVPILWQNSGIIFFNKPQGLSTHGPHSLDSIVNAWLADGGAGPLPRSLSFKPGPLHRLDKPTSGAIAFSQTLEGAKLFSALLRERKIEKIYIAIVEGRIEKEETWNDALAHDKKTRKSFVTPDPSPLRASAPLRLFPRVARTKGISTIACIEYACNCAKNSEQTAPQAPEAITTVKTLATNNSYSLIEARIKTGRHHQIRAQAAYHGHPLAGDIKYGGKPLPGQSRGGEFFLHAWKIKFNAQDIPDSFPREITAPLPQAFQAQIEALFADAQGKAPASGLELSHITEAL